MLGGEIASYFEHKVEHHDMTSSSVELTAYQTREDVPFDVARSLLNAHLTWAYDEFRALGAPKFDLMEHARRFFLHFDSVLPPNGAYFLAHDANKQAVGTGSLRRISDDTAEMKHLYVRPEARGAGVGQSLINARISAARALGIKTLVADTFCGNDPMIRLYRSAGFKDSAPYDSAVATITPELIPHLHYFRMEL
ncbi:GNAT family N-acetyltransferase [Actibacterium pelagium]|uniref:N-acetyltransferase domain-containing protein n=1 Tax=Actibacterium pelagium TaxID=2029103 RepID=A0A917ABZ2_9RHOB|nr:GNAT family N-acetyltransferase [Actibacterium pelagium]GGE39720.1 hypothetical protein GCM10011517_04300 [Actibacterium pelagium]